MKFNNERDVIKFVMNCANIDESLYHFNAFIVSRQVAGNSLSINTNIDFKYIYYIDVLLKEHFDKNINDLCFSQNLTYIDNIEMIKDMKLEELIINRDLIPNIELPRTLTRINRYDIDYLQRCQIKDGDPVSNKFTLKYNNNRDNKKLINHMMPIVRSEEEVFSMLENGDLLL